MKTNYQNARLLDMIFENRNKAYGAYALRNDYSRRISNALLITISSLFMLFLSKFISDKLKHHSETVIACPDGKFDPILPVTLYNKPIEIPKPKPVEPPKAQAIETERNTEMNVTANNQATDSIPTVEDLRDAESGINTNLNGNTIGVTDGTGNELAFTPVPETSPVSKEIPHWVEKMPEFPGGEEALRKFLNDNTRFPDMEREMGIGGKVISEFTVNENGKVFDIKILKSPSKGFDKEVTRVVKLMPAFTPGMQHEKPVKVRFVLPFTFSVSDY